MCIVYIYINQYICQFLYHRHCWKTLPECPLFARTLLNSRPSWRLKFGVDLGSCHPGWRSQPSGGLMKFNEIDFVYLDTLENLLGESYQSEDNFNFYSFILRGRLASWGKRLIRWNLWYGVGWCFPWIPWGQVSTCEYFIGRRNGKSDKVHVA